MKSRLEAKVGTILPQVKIKNKINGRDVHNCFLPTRQG